MIITNNPEAHTYIDGHIKGDRQYLFTIDFETKKEKKLLHDWLNGNITGKYIRWSDGKSRTYIVFKNAEDAILFRLSLGG